MRSDIILHQGGSLLVVALLTLTGLFLAYETCRVTDDLPSNHPRRETPGHRFQLKQFQVEAGSEDAAKTYYQQTVAPHLQFLTPDTILNSTVMELLEYFGYGQVTARELHRSASNDLMQLSGQGDILATRFFAPKITDVADKPVEIPDGGFGWRKLFKLLRLKAKADSAAANNGMESLLFLQNIFEKTVQGDPFNAAQNVSKFNQPIVVRKEGPFSATRQPIYFWTYGPLVKVENQGQLVRDPNGNFQDEGKLILSLKATFDEEDRDPETNLAPKEYFGPRLLHPMSW